MLIQVVQLIKYIFQREHNNFREQLAHQGLVELQELMALQVRVEHQELAVHQDLVVLQVQVEHQELVVLLEQAVLQGFQVIYIGQHHLLYYLFRQVVQALL